MLWDWNSIDRVSGQRVADMVRDDLRMLRANGFNFVHLYLWDNTWFGANRGFAPPGRDPRMSDNDQFASLGDFMRVAEEAGMYVAVTFAAQSPIQFAGQCTADCLNAAEARAHEYATWVRHFVELFSTRNNLLMLGYGFAIGVYANQGDDSPPNRFFRIAYTEIETALAPLRARAPGLGKLAVMIENTWGRAAEPYTLDALRMQQQVATMRALLGRDPDIYMVQLYNRDADALETGLRAAIGPSLGAGASPVPADKIEVMEFGTSTSMEAAPNGNGFATVGDWWTPTTNWEDQASWLTNTLCVFQRLNIRKMAYWFLYDAVETWMAPPFMYTGEALAWNGYWGLQPASESSPPKPSWSVLSQFYRDGALACSGGPFPIVSLSISPSQVSVGEEYELSIAASDFDSVTLDDRMSLAMCPGSPGCPMEPAPVRFRVRATTEGLITHAVKASRTRGGAREDHASASVRVVAASIRCGDGVCVAGEEDCVTDCCNSRTPCDAVRARSSPSEFCRQMIVSFVEQPYQWLTENAAIALCDEESEVGSTGFVCGGDNGVCCSIPGGYRSGGCF